MTGMTHDLRSQQDPDPVETTEWVDALEAMTAAAGRDRAQFVLAQVQERARRLGVTTAGLPFSAYRNTIPLARPAGLSR